MIISSPNGESIAYIKNIPNKRVAYDVLLIGNEVVSLYSNQSCYLEELKSRKCYNRNY